MPWSEAVPFVAEATKTKLRPGVPYMLLPVFTKNNDATHYPTARADFYLNLGTFILVIGIIFTLRQFSVVILCIVMITMGSLNIIFQVNIIYP